MSFQDWLHYAAIGACLTVCVMFGDASHAQDDAKQPPSTAETEQTKPSDKQPLSVTVVDPVSLERERTAEPNWAKPDCSKPQNHDEADLCEQRQMSLAAKKTVELNYVQIAVALGRFLALLWSIGLNRKATNAAIAAAEAADRAVSEASNTAKHQLRAYVTVAKYGFTRDEDGQPVIQIGFANVGQTDALRVRLFARLDVFPHPWPFGMAVPEARYIPPMIFYHPGGTADVPVRADRHFTPAELEGICEPTTTRLGVIGHIEYFDTFGDRHETPFASAISGGEVVRLILLGLYTKEQFDAGFRVRFESMDLGRQPA